MNCEGCGGDLEPTDGSGYAHGDGEMVRYYCSRECWETHT
jgi:ribosomal protein L24E